MVQQKSGNGDSTTQDQTSGGTLDQALHKAQDAIGGAYESTVHLAGDALEASRRSARQASELASHGAETNPLLLLLGGLAAGVAIGLTLPRTEQEARLLGPTGQKLHDTFTAALGAAKEAGREELANAGIGRDAAKTQIRRLLEGAMGAVGTAAAAAAKGNASTTA